MSHHILGDGHVVVDLPVVHLELEPHEAGQDGGGARLRSDRRRRFLAGLGAYDGEAVACQTQRVRVGSICGKGVGVSDDRISEGSKEMMVREHRKRDGEWEARDTYGTM